MPATPYSENKNAFTFNNNDRDLKGVQYREESQIQPQIQERYTAVPSGGACGGGGIPQGAATCGHSGMGMKSDINGTCDGCSTNQHSKTYTAKKGQRSKNRNNLRVDVKKATCMVNICEEGESTDDIDPHDRTPLQQNNERPRLARQESVFDKIRRQRKEKSRTWWLKKSLNVLLCISLLTNAVFITLFIVNSTRDHESHREFEPTSSGPHADKHVGGRNPPLRPCQVC